MWTKKQSEQLNKKTRYCGVFKNGHELQLHQKLNRWRVNLTQTAHSYFELTFSLKKKETLISWERKSRLPITLHHCHVSTIGMQWQQYYEHKTHACMCVCVVHFYHSTEERTNSIIYKCVLKVCILSIRLSINREQRQRQPRARKKNKKGMNTQRSNTKETKRIDFCSFIRLPFKNIIEKKCEHGRQFELNAFDDNAHVTASNQEWVK